MKKLSLKNINVGKAKAVANLVSAEDVQGFSKIVSEEVKDYKLTKENRQKAAEKLGVDEETANGWQTAADIVKHFDLVEIAQRHPEEIGATVKKILSVLGMIIPVVQWGNIITERLSNESVAKVVGYAGYLTPAHLMNNLASHFAKKKKAEELTDGEVGTATDIEAIKKD